MPQSLIIQYTNLLHQYGGPNAGPVKEFVANNRFDQTFLNRVAVLNKVFEIKEKVMHTNDTANLDQNGK